MAETLAKRFAELENAKQIRPRISRPKIQRVANYLPDREDVAKHYSPKLVSMGPIHHGDPNLWLGDQYKLMWAAMYIESTGHSPQILHQRIAGNIEKLKGLFTTDLFTNFNYTSEGFVSLEEKLSWVLFVDGCALLQILEKAKLYGPEEMKVRDDQLALVMHDIILFENQLPYQVLKLLWRDNNESALIETMMSFLPGHHWATDNADQRHQGTGQLGSSAVYATLRMPTLAFSAEAAENPDRGMGKHNNIEEDEESTVVDVSQGETPIHQQSRVVDVSHPAHLLDLQRTIILPPKTKCNEASKENKREKYYSDDMVIYRNIQELRAAGIRLKSSKTRWLGDISFSHGWFAGELTLPEIVVDDTTAATFLNLIAYELCPDFDDDHEICSFVAFLDSLIDHPDDVKVLRSQRLLLNSLGSDEEVARLFNTISTDLVPDTVTSSSVRAQIEKHYRNKFIKYKTWIALGYRTYFDNPWSIIAFLAAVLALALTFVQTWFAIYPPK